MALRQFLRRETALEGRPIFLQGGRLPLFRGVAQPEGSDFVCGWCRESVLAENILPRQLWDLTLGCFRCAGRSVFPNRPVGSPLGRNVGTPFPRTRVVVRTSPIELSSGVVYSSVACADAREKELARLAAPLRDLPSRSLAGPRVLLELVERARMAFRPLIDSDSHPGAGRSARRDPHRQRFLVERVQASAQSFPHAIDIPAIIELDLVVELAQAWATHPSWRTRIKTLRDPGELSHGILEMAAASFLIAIGNDVGPQAPQERHRTADLECVISAADVLSLEVKVPRRHQWPTARSLTHDEAVAVVNRALGSAGTGPGGQLEPGTSGLLVVGGYHVPLDEAALLRDVAKECLTQEHSHISAAMVVGLATHSAGEAVDGLVQVPAGRGMGCAIIHLVALNPFYTGPIILRARESPDDLRDLPSFGEQRQLLPGGPAWEESGR